VKPVRCPDQNRERFQCAGENRTCHLNHVASANIVGLCDGQSVSMNAAPQFVLDQPIGNQALPRERDSRSGGFKQQLGVVAKDVVDGVKHGSLLEVSVTATTDRRKEAAPRRCRSPLAILAPARRRGRRRRQVGTKERPLWPNQGTAVG